MTSRQRVLAALSHRQPDRVPLALMWNELTGPDGQPIEPDLARQMLGADVAIVRTEPTTAGQSFQRYIESLPADIFLGDHWQLHRYHAWDYRPERSPAGSDQPSPLRHATSPADIDRFVFPNFGAEAAFTQLRQQIAHLHANHLAVFALPPRLGGVLFEAAWRLRGFETFMCDLLEARPVSLYLLDRLTDLACHYAALIAAAGPDVLYIGDDIAEPTGLMISPALWRAVFAPRFQRIAAAARQQKPDIHICFHSDGCFTALLPDLIAVGIDAIEPVQPDCMDPLQIKRRFGSRLTMVGCAGTACLLHHGSPTQVRREVRQRITDLAAGGGLILAPAYDLMPSAPWANVEAFFDEARRVSA